MKKITSFIGYIILIANAFFCGLFLISAYSSYINPARFPILSTTGLAIPFLLIIVFAFFIFWLFIKTRYSLLSLVVLLVAFPQIRAYAPINFNTSLPNDGGRPIKVLSYNVMSLGGFNGWDQENPVMQYILDQEADIVCLQEYNGAYLSKRQNREIEKLYPYRSYENIGENGSCNTLALFSRYPILSTRTLPFVSKYNGATVSALKVNNDTLYVINTHLESNKLDQHERESYEQMLIDPKADAIKTGLPHLIKKLGESASIRGKQADYIAEEIKKLPKNSFILLCGDFNDTPNSYTHRIISQDLNDTFIRTGNGPGISFNRHKLYFRIDHILTSKNIKSYDCKVDRYSKDSDHYPISCIITLD